MASTTRIEVFGLTAADVKVTPAYTINEVLHVTIEIGGIRICAPLTDAADAMSAMLGKLLEIKKEQRNHVG